MSAEDLLEKKLFRRVLALFPWLLAGSVCLPAAILLVVCLANGEMIERIALHGTDARQFVKAERWISKSQDWSPPPSLEAADEGILSKDLTWTPVTLPNGFPEELTGRSPFSPANVPPEPAQVVWYRVDLGTGLPQGTRPISQIYFPRVYVRGTAAVYVLGRMEWRQNKAQVIPPYYEPVLIDVFPGARAGPPDQPTIVYVRLAARARDGMALSAPWTAPSTALTNAHGLRSLLQGGVVTATWVAYWFAGAFAFAMYLWRRRGRDREVYFWFSLLSLAAPTILLSYAVSPFVLHREEILIFMALSGVFFVSIFAVNFFRSVLNIEQTILLKTITICYMIITIAMSYRAILLVKHGNQIAIVDELMQILFIPSIIQSMYVVYFLYIKRNAMSLVVFFISLLTVLAFYHDIMTASHRGYLDDLMYVTYVTPGSLLIYVVMMSRSYVSSVRAAERARTDLEAALIDKERELERSHSQLMQVQHEQTLAQERQRMMQEMHDGIGSSLMSALHYLKRGERDGATVAQVLEECIDDLKLSIDSLEPAGGDLLQLLASLRFRLGPRLQGSGIELAWDVNEMPQLHWLDAQSSMHVLRILQEVLTNLLKHSRADALRLSTTMSARETDPGIAICVQDNGHPFRPPPPAEISPARRGLGNVISRTRQLGGQCEWEPQAEGNRFTLWLPLRREAEARGLPSA